MHLSVKSNIAQFRRQMRREQRSQLPFATAVALTRTGKDAKAAVEKKLPDVFDRPTPFTQRGVAALPASKRRMYSRVLIKDAQAKYLKLQEDGGTRRPAGRALVIPFSARRNRYGNIARGGVRRLLARDDTFSGVVRGIGGIWQRRRDGTVVLLVAYEDQATYRPRFGFAKTVDEIARQRFDAHFRAAFSEAMETARR